MGDWRISAGKSYAAQLLPWAAGVVLVCVHLHARSQRQQLRAALAERSSSGFVTYEYQKINISLEPSPDLREGFRKATIETAANRWAEMGWRTVAVMPSQGKGYADAILIERRKAV